MAIKQGDTIKVHYVGTLDDGTVFDSSVKRGEPLEFTVGAGQLIKGFDEAVVGMEAGEEKEIHLEAEEAYGDWNPDAVKRFPRDQYPEGQTPVAGMTVGLSLPNGQQIPAVITEVTEQEIALDLNHPLAGKALNFKIQIVE
jgi:FKBP-type peptidyl-prolyl cis-trans isomerase 2